MSTHNLKTLDDALEWARMNCTGEAVERLRSRQAVKLLTDEIERLRRGEFVCRKCGLRKDSEHPKTHEF